MTDLLLSSEHGISVGYALSTNSITCKKDSEEHTLVFTLNLLRSCTPERRTSLVSSLLETGSQKPLIRNLLTDQWFRDLLLDLMEFESFSYSKEINKKTVWDKWHGKNAVIGGVSF